MNFQFNINTDDINNLFNKLDYVAQGDITVLSQLAEQTEQEKIIETLNQESTDELADELNHFSSDNIFPRVKNLFQAARALDENAEAIEKGRKDIDSESTKRELITTLLNFKTAYLKIGSDSAEHILTYVDEKGNFYTMSTKEEKSLLQEKLKIKLNNKGKISFSNFKITTKDNSIKQKLHKADKNYFTVHKVAQEHGKMIQRAYQQGQSFLNEYLTDKQAQSGNKIYYYRNQQENFVNMQQYLGFKLKGIKQSKVEEILNSYSLDKLQIYTLREAKNERVFYPIGNSPSRKLYKNSNSIYVFPYQKDKKDILGSNAGRYAETQFLMKYRAEKLGMQLNDSSMPLSDNDEKTKKMIEEKNYFALALMIAQRIDSDNVPGLYKGDVGTMGGKSHAIKSGDATSESYDFYVETARKIMKQWKEDLFGTNAKGKISITRRAARAFLSDITLSKKGQLYQAFSFDPNIFDRDAMNQILSNM